MKKKLIGLFVVTLLLLTGCGLGGAKNSKVFDEGNFKITLNENFEKKTLASATYYYENNKDTMGLTVLLETYDSLSALNMNKDTTLKEYADVIIKQMPSATMKTEGNFMYFTYSKPVSGSNYFYMATMFKGEKGFYLLNFFCFDKDKDTNLDKFLSWAKTVEV